jgi:hypothetical protein
MGKGFKLSGKERDYLRTLKGTGGHSLREFNRATSGLSDVLVFIDVSAGNKSRFEIQVLKLCNVAELYSVSRIWADSDKKKRICSSASIVENPLLAVRPSCSFHDLCHFKFSAVNSYVFC